MLRKINKCNTIRSFGTSTFSPDIHPEIEVGRLWKFLILNSELYANFCFTIGNHFIDFSRNENGLNDAYQTYHSDYDSYKNGLKAISKIHKKYSYYNQDVYTKYEVWMTRDEIKQVKRDIKKNKIDFTKVSFSQYA